MKLKGICAAMVAMSVVAAPTMAAAAPAATPLTHTVAPVVTPLTQPANEVIDGDNAFFHGTSLIVLFLAIAAITAGIIAATTHTRTTSVSP